MGFVRGLFAANRAALFTALAPRQPVWRQPSARSFHTTQTLFASDADMLKQFKSSQISRVSKPGRMTDQLISAVRSGNYMQARMLAKSGADVNGHNKGENTALTDAAERGDSKGVEFLLKDLGANPYASCDCPQHMTAMHYAAKKGHVETLKVFVKHGVNLNVLCNGNNTPLDLARSPEVKQLLIASGGKTHRELEQLPVMTHRLLPK